jgi:hypothetical protein
MKKRSGILIVVLAVIAGFVGGSLSSWIFATKTAVADNGFEEKVSSRQFITVDEDGNAKAILTVDDGGPALFMYDESDNPRAILMHDKETGTALVLNGEENDNKIVIMNSAIAILDKKGKTVWSTE